MLAEHGAALEELDLSFKLVPSPCVSAPALTAHIPRFGSTLTNLNLSYLDNVNDDVVAAIAAQCRRLVGFIPSTCFLNVALYFLVLFMQWFIKKL